MSLSIDGVWKAGVWATTVWAAGVWFEGSSVPTPSVSSGGGGAGGGGGDAFAIVAAWEHQARLRRDDEVVVAFVAAFVQMEDC